MSTESISRASEARFTATANERLKRSWGRCLWGAISLGAALHAAVLVYTPEVEVPLEERSALSPAQLMHVATVFDAGPTPPAPDILIPRPALPTDLGNLDPNITLDPADFLLEFDFFDPTDRNLAPPLQTERDEWLEYKQFAPFVVRPEIRNRTELKRFLERNYQRIYEYSGDTGVVQITFWIDEGGMVEKAEIAQSSGSRSLDRLALRLSRVLRFRPAMLAGRPVRILVNVPITFRAA